MANQADLDYPYPQLINLFNNYVNNLTKLRFNSDNDLLVTSSMDSTAILWGLKNSESFFCFDAHSEPITDIAWSPNGRLVASASMDRTVKIWQPKLDGPSTEFLRHSSAVTSIDFNTHGSSLATGSYDKTVKLWSVSTRKVVSCFPAHTNTVRATRFGPDNRIVGSCSEDRTVRIFDVRNGECTRIFHMKDDGNSSIPWHIDWHPAGKLIAVALSCGCVRIYDVGTGALIQLYQVHTASVNDICFHMSGNFLVTASDDATVKILDVLKGRMTYTILGHSNEVNSVHFSPNGERFASCGNDKLILVWKANLNNFDREMFKKRQEEEALSMNKREFLTEKYSLEDEPSTPLTYIDQRSKQNYILMGPYNSVLIDPRRSEEHQSVDEIL